MGGRWPAQTPSQVKEDGDSRAVVDLGQEGHDAVGGAHPCGEAKMCGWRSPRRHRRRVSTILSAVLAVQLIREIGRGLVVPWA
ncbi:hypothetical protein GWK47_041526 [Chionoecetes opilio]|uniref:Uncharacterized protein n=1 Tax=Chionoecetes opilio TaxID=41210 RepID=A0A8J5CWT4_CHIOP|nr:hypothetical protein GWK47_041526 [Chionoecetes opilio]